MQQNTFVYSYCRQWYIRLLYSIVYYSRMLFLFVLYCIDICVDFDALGSLSKRVCVCVCARTSVCSVCVTIRLLQMLYVQAVALLHCHYLLFYNIEICRTACNMFHCCCFCYGNNITIWKQFISDNKYVRYIAYTIQYTTHTNCKSIVCILNTIQTLYSYNT